MAEAGDVIDRESLRCTLNLEEGEPAACIVKATRTLGTDLVLMGTRGLGRVASVAIGSIAEAVPRQAPVPVTMVR